MRVATVDGIVTLFYDGMKKLFIPDLNYEFWNAYCDNNGEEDEWESWPLSDECKNYFRERLSWQQIIIVEGVTEIPDRTFMKCWNIKRVIFADTVVRIKGHAFENCKSLVYVKISINLEYIGKYAFSECDLSSVFIPPSCREICNGAFGFNANLSILSIPRHVELGRYMIQDTKLAEASPFEVAEGGYYDSEVNDDMNIWIKNMNHDEAFTLHRACASFQPLKQVLSAIIQEKGLKAFRKENNAGIAPSQYLTENPYTELKEKELIHDYVMKIMGEVE
ncbi:hypothetical protein CTEN210_18367 [Chaetoceros tenuissimus]|uniref:Leucine-rich repeat domain-containing protein n=1 Tax=Chaetoceros tenuissimus TaxID=426638 RepID=A0AAD3HFY6_9STRA|nr:hypothetical protein CTEN210_18367 [Chaetoceros tenuissimus]